MPRAVMTLDPKTTLWTTIDIRVNAKAAFLRVEPDARMR